MRIKISIKICEEFINILQGREERNLILLISKREQSVYSKHIKSKYQHLCQH